MANEQEEHVEEQQQEEQQVEGEQQEEEAKPEAEAQEEGHDGTKKEPSSEEKTEQAAEEVTAVTIGDTEPPAEEKAPDWVREVRKRNRELEKENKELRRAQSGQQTIVVGKKPTMADPEIDYDADKFEKALSEWTERKNKADAEAEKVEQQQKTEQAAWQAKLDAFGESKKALKVPDMDAAEALVQETLSERQLAIIIKGAKNAPLLVYALGRNPAKLQELAKVTDLVEFAATVFRDVEGQLKVTTKKPTPPAPEKKVMGAAPSGGMDSTLDKLRAEAERTGDYSKVHQHKQQKKAA